MATADDVDVVRGTGPAVTLTGITKRFDDVVAVENIDLAIADGEFFAMLGPRQHVHSVRRPEHLHGA